MYYLNSKPVSSKPSHFTPKRRFQWRGFRDEAGKAIKTIRKDFELIQTETRKDTYFILPGRRDMITRLGEDETITVRRRMVEDGDFEQWETAVETTIPMKRSTAARIGRHLPVFNAPCVSAENGHDLCESLSKKSKSYTVNATRKHYVKGDVEAVISRVKIDGEKKITIALTSPDREALQEMVRELGLNSAANQNFGEFLLAA
ncbi:hypothetical protein [Robiginitomaculum antarcticum]|uniref:hypothetical protein n=1 Tax=Robiginitomaculum antarcticum TaxID=437507 RepID=UPI0012E9A3E8|nr:hypothetical protein [Robiginitomaculum antarcticum]